MEVWKCLLLLVCFYLESSESGGGHGGSKHEIIKIHVPEFIEHKHHTKYIVIHHHPKKSHHHHHHKPKIHHKPHGHHHFFYHKKKGHKKTHTATSSHGHGHHGHGHHHGHHGHHHGHKHHVHKEHKKHHDPSYEEEDTYVPFTPQQSYLPQVPKVYGVTHTFKEVKMYDSLPFNAGHNPFQAAQGHGAPPNPGAGYQVTEEEEEQGNSISNYPQYQTTYNYQPTQKDPFAAYAPQPTQRDPFAAYAPQPASQGTPVSDFQFDYQQNEAPEADFEYTPAEYPGTALESGYAYGNQDAEGNFNPAEHFTDEHKDFVTSLQPKDDSQFRKVAEDIPVTFERASGVQKTVKTAGHETLVY